MGLIKDVRTASGILVRNAYFRIDTININKESCNLSLLSYISREAFVEGKAYITSENYTFKAVISDEAPNLFKQAYNHLKLNEGFEDAEDVLEV